MKSNIVCWDAQVVEHGICLLLFSQAQSLIRAIANWYCHVDNPVLSSKVNYSSTVLG